MPQAHVLFGLVGLFGLAALLAPAAGCAVTPESSAVPVIAGPIDGGPADVAPIAPAPPTSDAAAARPTTVLDFASEGELRPPDWRSLPYDAEITSVTFEYDLLAGGQVDYAVAINRPPPAAAPYPAITGGYADLLTTHPFRFASADHWTQRLALDDTPLFLPANTEITCWSSGGTDVATKGPRSCRIEVRSAAKTRHRILRIPYLDAMQEPGEAFLTSHYRATAAHPLRVKGFMLYDGVVGTYDACLQHKDGVTGAIIAEHCLPKTSRTTTTNSDSHGVARVDWTVHAPNTISARCDVTTGTTYDCAFYVIVEIPEAIAPSPENVVRDYGSAPPTLLQSWCAHYVDEVIVPAQRDQLCYAFAMVSGQTPGTPCTRDELVEQCRAAFPRASACQTSFACEG